MPATAPAYSETTHSHGVTTFTYRVTAVSVSRAHRIFCIRISETIAVVLSGVLPVLWVFLRFTAKNGPLSVSRCPTCGYDLTCNVSGTCPECGKAAPGHLPND